MGHAVAYVGHILCFVNGMTDWERQSFNEYYVIAVITPELGLQCKTLFCFSYILNTSKPIYEILTKNIHQASRFATPYNTE